MLAGHRSVVKIKNTGCANTYSTGSAVSGNWAASATQSPDGCVVQYTTLPTSAVAITALAIDGEDSLWVCPIPSASSR